MQEVSWGWITRTSGNAAAQIGGTTLYSACGLDTQRSPNKQPPLFSEAKKWVWKQKLVLVIDEVSMLGGATLYEASYHLQSLRNCQDKPFGGLPVVLLMGGLAVGLYTAAGEVVIAKTMGIVYMLIAVFAGAWGYSMLRVRRNMILERSGKDFDNMVGPIVVSISLMMALTLDFVFQYRAAFARMNDGEQEGGEHVVDEF